MKKISLKNLNLKEVEQLSREQLKDVLGGWTGGSGSDEGTEQTNYLCECECGKTTGISPNNGCDPACQQRLCEDFCAANC